MIKKPAKLLNKRMSVFETIKYYSGALLDIGVFIGGIGYLLRSWKKEDRDEKTEVMSSSDTLTNFWKEQAEGYKVVMAEKDKANDIKFTALTKEVGEIRGQLIEKEKQNTQYLEILQNRNPEMQKFMEFMIQAMKNQDECNTKISTILSEIHTMAKAEHERDFNITAQITKTS